MTGRVAIGEFDGSPALTPVFGDGRPAVWRWSRPRVEERPDDLECRVIRGRSGERVDIFQRDWLHREGGRRKKLRTIWLAEEIGSTDTAVAELKAVVGHVFESPKPTGLVRRILSTLPADVVVLDPFAGSGTTGHAVALANARRRRHPPLHQHQLHRAHPRGLQRPASPASPRSPTSPAPASAPSPTRSAAGSEVVARVTGCPVTPASGRDSKRRSRISGAARQTPAARSRALSSSSRCWSRTWRWGTVRRQPVRPKHILPS